MTYTFAKELSESYKGSEISFDNTTGAAVAKGFVSTSVQDAIVEAKYIHVPVYASTTVAGLVRKSTDTESLVAAAVMAFITPDQLAAKINNFWTTVIQPAILPPTVLPRWIYGGYGTVASMTATFAAVPVGSIIVYEEYYTYVHGWGNGSSTLAAYIRRSIVKTENAGWQYTDFMSLPA